MHDARASIPLLYGRKLNIEHEVGIGRDLRTGRMGTIRLFSGDDQPSNTANLHSRYAFCPAIDHLIEPERNRISKVMRALEYSTVRHQCPRIVSGDRSAGSHRGA